MILSNQSLRQMLETSEIEIITPYPGDKNIQPCSVDVHINPFDIWQWVGATASSDGSNQQPEDWHRIVGRKEDDKIIVLLKPGIFYRMSTLEYFRIPTNLCAFLHGVSTMARLGYVCHQQAGLLDPGWEGVITGEVTVVTYLKLVLSDSRDPDFKAPRLGQVVFHTLTEIASPSYKGRYQGDKLSSPARFI